MTTKNVASQRIGIRFGFTESILLLLLTVAVLWFGGEIARAQNSAQPTPPPGAGAATPTQTPKPNQTPAPNQAPPPTPAASVCPTPGPSPSVPKGGAFKLGSQKNETDETKKYGEPVAGMNDIIIVRVQHLKELMNEANCKTCDGKDLAGCTKQKIVLFLDGRPMKGLVPESIKPVEGTPNEGELQFHIQRMPDSDAKLAEAADEQWADLLGSPPIGEGLFIRPVEVSVGLENGSQIRSEATKFSFIRVHSTQFWFALVGLIAILIALIFLAQRTSLLRDDGPAIGENRKGEQNGLLSYSLGRCQMAFWFVLIITSFIFIFVITWQFDTITNQALALMGISAGTAMGAAFVSANKEDESEAKLQAAAIRYPELRADKKALATRIKEIPAKAQRTPDEQQELEEKSAALLAVKKEIKSVSTVSQGFLDDVLTDIHGYSFHRFQIFVWTIVLGIIFLLGVYGRLSMPKFSGALLALMGISGATYIGFKIPEKQEPEPNPPV